MSKSNPMVTLSMGTAALLLVVMLSPGVAQASSAPRAHGLLLTPTLQIASVSVGNEPVQLTADVHRRRGTALLFGGEIFEQVERVAVVTGTHDKLIAVPGMQGNARQPGVEPGQIVARPALQPGFDTLNNVMPSHDNSVNTISAQCRAR